MQAGRVGGKERGRMESREGARGGWEEESGGRERASEEVRECRERESRKGRRVEGGWIEEGNERGSDGERGGRKRAEEGGNEQGSRGGRDTSG